VEVVSNSLQLDHPYIQTVPRQIQTEARDAIRAQLGWQDAELPDILLENM
jgi:hypothetical protein